MLVTVGGVCAVRTLDPHTKLRGEDFGPTDRGENRPGKVTGEDVAKLEGSLALRSPCTREQEQKHRPAPSFCVADSFSFCLSQPMAFTQSHTSATTEAWDVGLNQTNGQGTDE